MEPPIWKAFVEGFWAAGIWVILGTLLGVAGTWILQWISSRRRRRNAVRYLLNDIARNQKRLGDVNEEIQKASDAGVREALKKGTQDWRLVLPPYEKGAFRTLAETGVLFDLDEDLVALIMKYFDRVRDLESIELRGSVTIFAKIDYVNSTLQDASRIGKEILERLKDP